MREGIEGILGAGREREWTAKAEKGRSGAGRSGPETEILQ